jgi:4-amino-4-deoxy-L-arabinose transferase-like glycosyltransferase
MGLSALGVGVVYAWGKAALSSRPAGLVAAVSLAAMPRVFFHSHLACFDMPVASLWLVTAYAYWRSLERGGLAWPLATGVLYGLLLNTKHNAWLLPPALVAHFLVTRGRTLWSELRHGRLVVPRALLAMALIGPAVFYATWPWIWRDTWQRLADYVAFHTGHEYYNMEFLGRTYWKPPMPRLYAGLMTLATVPSVILCAAALGAVRAGKQALAARAAPGSRFGTDALWFSCVLVGYAPWLASSTPIFGGTKHWITAYPFVALLAARGFHYLTELAATAFERRRTFVEGLGAAAMLAGPVLITARSHPWGLSSYAPLVGGAPGAATLGLNRTFWGYTTGAAQTFLNENAPRNARVYVHDTALQSWAMLAADGRVRPDLRGTLSITGSDLALYHHEQHMQRVEHQVWIDYGTLAPSFVGTHQGVPVIWVYVRPAEAP